MASPLPKDDLESNLRRSYWDEPAKGTGNKGPKPPTKNRNDTVNEPEAMKTGHT